MSISLKSEVVRFRDDSELVVTEATWPVAMHLQELQEHAEANPLEDTVSQIFNVVIYPKLAACSTGAVPDLETALSMPSTEVDKWYFAVKRINPDWFEALEKMSEEMIARAAEKKELKPIESILDS